MVIDRKEAQRLNREMHRRNITRFGLDLNPIVSLVASCFIVFFSVYALIHLDQVNRWFSLIQETLVTHFDWVFILSSNFFVLICLYLAASRIGNVRIGGVDAVPEFSNFAWYSMLISAGMGIGLIFWSVGEPLYHYTQAPPIFSSPDAAITAMAATFFHWGLHPWGIYALISLALAFFAYNRKLPLSLRSVFFPLLGRRVYGTLGDVIDVFAVLSTMFGLATSLGFGVQQINSGLDYLLDIGFSVGVQILLIAGITMVAIVSVVLGIDRGIKFLSQLNIRIAFVFMMALLLLGPTVGIIRLFANSLGLYLNQFIQSSFFISRESSAWQGEWSVFYLAWWISWSPFVGLFIARMSRGRTIREFVLGVLIVPSLLSFLWLSVFGGTAIFSDQASDGALFAAVQDNVPVALYQMMDMLEIPFAPALFRVLLSLLATVLIAFYFVTSSDSGSLVIDKITSGGKLHSPVKQRVFWACLEGLLAATLLVIGGEMALEALQTAVIITGFPMAILLTVMTVSLMRGLKLDKREQRMIRESRRIREILEAIEEEEVGVDGNEGM